MKAVFLATLLAAAASQYTHDLGPFFGRGGRGSRDGGQNLAASAGNGPVAARRGGFLSGGSAHGHVGGTHPGSGSRREFSGRGRASVSRGGQSGGGRRGGPSATGVHATPGTGSSGRIVGIHQSSIQQNRHDRIQRLNRGGFGRGSSGGHRFTVQNKRRNFAGSQNSLVGGGGGAGFVRGTYNIPVHGHESLNFHGGKQNYFTNSGGIGGGLNLGTRTGVPIHGVRSGSATGSHVAHGFGPSVSGGGGGSSGGGGGISFFGRGGGGVGGGVGSTGGGGPFSSSGSSGGGAVGFHAGPEFDFSAGGGRPAAGPGLRRTFGSAAFGGSGGSTYRGAGPNLRGSGSSAATYRSYEDDD